MSDGTSTLFSPHGSKTNWEQQAKNTIKLDQSVLKEHLYDLLTWLQDLNWPGANTISNYLQTLGEPLVPHIKEIFNSHYTQWVYFVLEDIVNNWLKELIVQITNELLKLTKIIDLDGNFISAFRLLIKHNILQKDEYRLIKDELIFRLTDTKDIYIHFLNDLSTI